MLTIVMYHYVRPLAQSAYPRIKGLDTALFDTQLDYLAHYYEPVTMENVLGALKGETELPERAVLLSFDDGYRDHYEEVFPRLEKRGFKGAFYPPAATALDREILDVNKVHFILAAAPDTGMLRQTLDAWIEEEAERTALPSLTALSAEYEKPFGYDDAETIYIKRLLQHALPEEIRSRLTNRLFAKFVSADEKDFAESLYCNAAELSEMREAGHHIGSHGDRHYWLSRLTPEDQRRDIENSMRLLDVIGASRKDFTFCYPYGDYNEATEAVLEELGCAAALTTKVGLAEITPENALRLPRLDTNHLPKESGAPANEWTQRVLGK